MSLSPWSDAATLGAACRLRRRALGLTLQDASGAAGVNYRFASEFERGKPTCALGLALRYARMLGVELFYDTGSDEPQRPAEGAGEGPEWIG
jgi:transcriptional regulator with XRE-family HTH domain